MNDRTKENKETRRNNLAGMKGKLSSPSEQDEQQEMDRKCRNRLTTTNRSSVRGRTCGKKSEQNKVKMNDVLEMANTKERWCWEDGPLFKPLLCGQATKEQKERERERGIRNVFVCNWNKFAGKSVLLHPTGSLANSASSKRGKKSERACSATKQIKTTT